MMHAEPLDTMTEIVTPEQIRFRHQLAGPFLRAEAYLIDLLIQAFLTFLLVLAATYWRSPFLVFAGIFFLSWGYGGVLETIWSGQTIGKRVLGIRVVSTQGLPINAQQAFLRNILRIIDLQPAMLVTAGLPILLTSKLQRLGDLAADTMVIQEESQQVERLKEFDTSPELRALLERIPPKFEGDAKWTEALSSYVLRRKSLSTTRRLELARLLAEPLCRRLQLPADTDADLLLRALYHRLCL